MAVVFATSRVNQREQHYGDVLGEVYEFPRAWANRVAEGDVFVYYRGTRGGGPAGYFEAGIVGPIRDSHNQGRRSATCSE